MTALNFRAFEEEVRDLLASELVREITKPIKVFRGRKYHGKSGTSHEIDVAFETKIAHSKLLFVVECKFYSRPVGIEKVRDFAYRIGDIGAHKGLMVTNIGYQRGAMKVAKAEGIGLLVVAKCRLKAVGGLPSPGARRWMWKLSIKPNVKERGLSLFGIRLNTIDRLGAVFPVDHTQTETNDPWDMTNYALKEFDITGESYAFLLPEEADAIGFKCFSPRDPKRYSKYIEKANFYNVFSREKEISII
jgi:hypothetical protein